MPYRKLLSLFLQPKKYFYCSSSEIFIHSTMWHLYSILQNAYETNEYFSTYLKKSSPLNQLAKGIQAVLSQIWEHREWVSSSHSRGCVGAWWWCMSHLGMVLCSIHSTSHSSSLGHLQRGWSEHWGEVQDSQLPPWTGPRSDGLWVNVWHLCCS